MHTAAGLPPSLHLVDRVFRVAGVVAIAALGATIAMALAGAHSAPVADEPAASAGQLRRLA